MKPQELRIGNWVNNPYDEPTQVDVTIIDYVDKCNNVKQKVERYGFIPLTEEWLLKFGFGLDSEFDNTYVDNNSLEQEVLFYNVKNRMFMIESHIDVIEIKHIHNVHQLQNIYYALIGEELKIKTC